MPLDLKEALTKKIGPLPGGAWAGIGALGFILIRKRKAATVAAPLPGTGDVTDSGATALGALGTGQSVWQNPDTIGAPPGLGLVPLPSVTTILPAPVVLTPAAPNPAPPPPNNGAKLNLPPIDLSTVNLIGHVVAELPTPSGGGIWVLTSSGAIYSFGDAQYKGGANGQAYFAGRTAAELIPNGQGYTIVATSGETYNYP
jgi:hypothetical protein